MIDEKVKQRAFTPPCKGDPAPREKIQKLGQKITDVIPHQLKGVSADDPEYWGLAAVVTDEMADIALKMELRHHYTRRSALGAVRRHRGAEAAFSGAA